MGHRPASRSAAGTRRRTGSTAASALQQRRATCAVGPVARRARIRSCRFRLVGARLPRRGRVGHPPRHGGRAVRARALRQRARTRRARTAPRPRPGPGRGPVPRAAGVHRRRGVARGRPAQRRAGPSGVGARPGHGLGRRIGGPRRRVPAPHRPRRAVVGGGRMVGGRARGPVCVPRSAGWGATVVFIAVLTLALVLLTGVTLRSVAAGTAAVARSLWEAVDVRLGADMVADPQPVPRRRRRVRRVRRRGGGGRRRRGRGRRGGGGSRRGRRRGGGGGRGRIGYARRRVGAGARGPHVGPGPRRRR